MIKIEFLNVLVRYYKNSFHLFYIYIYIYIYEKEKKGIRFSTKIGGQLKKNKQKELDS